MILARIVDTYLRIPRGGEQNWTGWRETYGRDQVLWCILQFYWRISKKKKKKKRKSRQYSLSVIGYSGYVFNTVFVTFAVVNAVSAVCVWR